MRCSAFATSVVSAGNAAGNDFFADFGDVTGAASFFRERGGIPCLMQCNAAIKGTE
jgi:hypothetical protein